jgi:hypothetical protein
VSLIVIECDDRRLSQRQYESINAKLAEVAVLVRACGIPEPFRAQLSAVDPVNTGVPHDFELLIGWEHMTVAARLSGWQWLEMSRDERCSYVLAMVTGACQELLRSVMRDRRECIAASANQKELAGR